MGVADGWFLLWPRTLGTITITRVGRYVSAVPQRDGHDDVIKWKHFPRNWPIVRGIHRSRWIPHKGQWRGALMSSLICVWIKGWVNNREADDLRRHHGHYDVIVMESIKHEYQEISADALCDRSLCIGPVRFEPRFRQVVFKLIVIIDGWGIFCEIFPRWMPHDFTDDKSTFFRKWHVAWQAITWINVDPDLSPSGVTRPQWVKENNGEN